MWKAPSILVVIVLVLLLFGLVMLASTSSVTGGDRYQDPSYFLKRQTVWLAVAVVAALVAALFIDYHWWKHWGVTIPLLAVTVVLLILVFVPGIGCKIGGSHRWLRVGAWQVGQPSEIAKFAAVVVMASWMTYAGRKARQFKEGLLIPGMGLAIVLGLILLEPDYGTTALVGAVGMIIMFAGGTRPSHLAVAGTLGACLFILAIMQNEERMARVMAFLDPVKYREQAYQLKQALDAFILGGSRGVGLGNSVQKHYYLPEAHTDFIIAIIGEELGVVATLSIAVLFVGVLICGIAISIEAPDMFGRLLGLGITTTIALQAAINIGVVTGCLPTKGLPLPFISAGGSSMVMSLFSVGVLINIARHASGAITDKHTRVIHDSMHWG